jgi:hypothetical protein
MASTVTWQVGFPDLGSRGPPQDLTARRNNDRRVVLIKASVSFF